jgi:uncharacterized membrane protein
METPASIGKHPVHSMLVPIPIGAWIFALVADLVASRNGDPTWYSAAFYAIGVGVAGALLAAVFGLVDLLALPPGPTRRTGIIHMSINLVAVVVFGLNLAMRWNEPDHAGSAVLTVLGVLLIGVSGWLGGELVYKGGVGVASDADLSPAGSRRRDPVTGRPVDARSH